ncbi:MAG TPA: phage integrase N-terminal SAM-like domain-containing protein [Edaphobacter sp.]|nr:phage integrase N-terminal SAM-like domain-containing protein [Edaphobacter sp.]
MTHLRQIMLQELQRRNYSESTSRAYIRTVEHYARHFDRSPDQLGPEHIRHLSATASPLDALTFTLQGEQKHSS